MGELILFRNIFQLGNQFFSSITYLYSLLFFAIFISKAVKGEVRFTKLEIVTFCYFVLSIGISALGSSVGTIISQFNKLFLCLLIFKVASEERIKPDGKLYNFALLTVTITAVYVCLSLLTDSSYSYQWGAKTFLMTFHSQHETAQFIVLLVASFGFDLVNQGTRPRAIKAIEVLLMSVLMYALLMTGARTITLCGVVTYVIFLSKLLDHVDNRIRPFLIVLIVIVACLTLLPHMSETVFFEKNANLSSSSFSNGREDIWSYYETLYADQPLIEQIFGSGVGLISERSMLTIGAHNDILTFLLSYGVVGLVLYIAYIVRNLLNKENGFQSFVLIAAFLFCVLSNGFVGYTELICAFALLRLTLVPRQYFAEIKAVK